MHLRDILQSKGSHVYSIAPQRSCANAVANMVHYGIGCLLVQAEPGTGSLLGIISERDILRVLAARQNSLDELRVAAVMSQLVVTAHPLTPILAAMKTMTVHRIRHLPVLEDQQVCGIVSIGDLVKSHHDQLELENHFMRHYIQGADADVHAPS